jgi:hypothetical protein
MHQMMRVRLLLSRRGCAVSLHRMSPLLAHSGHHDRPEPCPLLGGKADMSDAGLLPCKLITEPHFASRKSLL